MKSKNNTRFIRAEKGEYISTFIGTSSNIKCYERSIICIQENNKIYKIISIQASKKDESINAFFPYCKEKRAYIFQHKHKYKAGLSKIKKKKITKEFIVDETTKLSIHKSGFVQLSGKGILSGIDKKTGEAKGIGVFSSPLDDPVNSGPTFLFKCWGVSNGFELLNDRKKDVQYIILDKDKADFTERKFKKNDEPNTYLLEFFIFPKEANQFVYIYKDDPFIDHTIYNYLHNPGATFAQPVLDLKYFNGVICIFPALTQAQYANESKFGYGLGSPGGSNSIHDKSMTGNNFHLNCPRKKSFIMNKDNLNKLEY